MSDSIKLAREYGTQSSKMVEELPLETSKLHAETPPPVILPATLNRLHAYSDCINRSTRLCILWERLNSTGGPRALSNGFSLRIRSVCHKILKNIEN